MQQNEVIAIVPALRKNAASGRDNDVAICTYDLSKFAVVAVALILLVFLIKRSVAEQDAHVTAE